MSDNNCIKKMIKNKKKVPDLSAQELVDCTKNYGNWGCSGGFIHISLDYIFDKGLNTDSDYPYKGIENKCDSSKSGKGAFKIKKCTLLTGVRALQSSINESPSPAVFLAMDDFRFYKSGIYNPLLCKSKYRHVILVVGYSYLGDLPSFLIKNSWGEDWGEKGFFRMAIGRSQGTCEIGNLYWNYKPVLE